MCMNTNNLFGCMKVEKIAGKSGLGYGNGVIP
jgi:hypothetical protein